MLINFCFNSPTPFFVSILNSMKKLFICFIFVKRTQNLRRISKKNQQKIFRRFRQQRLKIDQRLINFISFFQRSTLTTELFVLKNANSSSFIIRFESLCTTEEFNFSDKMIEKKTGRNSIVFVVSFTLTKPKQTSN